MKQNLGIFIVLLGCLLLIIHAFAQLGNGMLWTGIIVEIIGIAVQIILNKR